MSRNHREKYAAELRPLVEKIRDICADANITFILAIEIDAGEVNTTLAIAGNILPESSNQILFASKILEGELEVTGIESEGVLEYEDKNFSLSDAIILPESKTSH